VRKLAITTATDFDALGKTLHALFKDASTYPSLIDSLYILTRQSILTHDFALAMKASQLAYELYPETAGANASYGLSLVLSGDSANGQERLRKATSINPGGLSSAASLNFLAFLLVGNGFVDEAITLVATGIALYPKEANLYDSMGELQLKKGDKAKALASYQKALEVNPNFPNAATAREIVKKLSDEQAQKQQ
jgi:tetratricopeptide (TPR) repeat protein